MVNPKQEIYHALLLLLHQLLPCLRLQNQRNKWSTRNKKYTTPSFSFYINFYHVSVSKTKETNGQPETRNIPRPPSPSTSTSTMSPSPKPKKQMVNPKQEIYHALLLLLHQLLPCLRLQN